MNSGLFHPDEFRDNCGFGLIAHMTGKKSHNLLRTAIQALTCMTHRGGISSDGKTGDGCGLLIQLPDTFFREIAKDQLHITLPVRYAVGMIFLSSDPEKRRAAQNKLEHTLAAQSLSVLGWRSVPINEQCLGPIAKKQMPDIQQIFVGVSDTIDSKTFAAKLYMARRYANMTLPEDNGCYICSLSDQVICYKGLVMPTDLPVFYQDLSNTRFKTAICVFHQRFSTNTLPRWKLAQPFRMLAHNGEINTITGNRNWSQARRNKLQSTLLEGLQHISPLINTSGSDSSSLDNMLELLITGGVDIYRAIRLVMPPAWQNVDIMDPDLKAFYEYNSMHMEPWDGPAGLVISDGRRAVCALDRNGLRPSRWMITTDGYLTVASETGVCNYPPEGIIRKGRVRPGEILSIDTKTGELLKTKEIDTRLKMQQPYKSWLKHNAVRLSAHLQGKKSNFTPLKSDIFLTYKKMFLVSYEECVRIIGPLADQGQEAIGAMGDDIPMAVLSKKFRSLYDYFRQKFAQVTNPAIDPLREAIVMSLETCLGQERNLFEETPAHAHRVILKSPILSPAKFSKIIDKNHPHMDLNVIKIDLNYHPSDGLQAAIEHICSQAEQAVAHGNIIVLLTDKNITPDKIPLHAILATGAVHHRLIHRGIRTDANIIVETATARESHHFAALLGFGATAIYPYLAYQLIYDRTHLNNKETRFIRDSKAYRRGINRGLLKIMSKMGISTIASYRGAELFEIIGIAQEVVSVCFKGAQSRIEGQTFQTLQEESIALAKYAWKKRQPVLQGGFLQYMKGGEYHAFNPDVVTLLQKATQEQSATIYQQYADQVNNRPITTLRDLLKLNPHKSRLNIDQVESASDVLKRFDSAAMSLGALSPEAHEVLAEAMNRLGARSNSGEGGEDPARFNTLQVSKIKQVASGRFGVTAHYLVNAEVIQIKIAQGAKPGEGGQLPGTKVNALIAKLRYSVPGVTLISPPPHHDIYSIEDLAQLIYDLKQVNPDALISVKLVSEPGVGTVAAGVAKAYADMITISGYDGGTAASPLSSVRYAGSPWELGVSEAHQALRSNKLRKKVRLQADGGLKTGLDVIKAAILGAESFGFGTTPMIAMGCKYLRLCHLNNCATGIATQNKELRDKHFYGAVESIMSLFTFIAEEVRQWLSYLGEEKLENIIGKIHLLKQIPGDTACQKNIDLSRLLSDLDIPSTEPQFCQTPNNPPFDMGYLATLMVQDCLPAIKNKTGGEFSYTTNNCDRTLGARLSGEIAKHYGNQGMIHHPIVIKLTGIAGQSLGAWNVGGLNIELTGDANDYVGKGMTGGNIMIRPPLNSLFKTQETPIIGNTCLYGATGGTLYAAGTAGERLAVRNSGAIAIVEGAGDHCCEYMTGGVVVVLGETGYNFGAGMTGGFAYVLDLSRCFVDHYNHDLVDIHRIETENMEAHCTYLLQLINDYVCKTNSLRGKEIIEDFYDYRGRFWLVKPKTSSLDSLLSNICTVTE